MQVQLQQTNEAVRVLEDDNMKLKSALSSREQELSRAGRLIGDAALTSSSSSTAGQALSASYHDSIANNAQVVEAANKRIIDQLNGQVDFLNDQLAQREAQLAVFSKKWTVVESDLALRYIRFCYCCLSPRASPLQLLHCLLCLHIEIRWQQV
jgi:hypothetical protein